MCTISLSKMYSKCYSTATVGCGCIWKDIRSHISVKKNTKYPHFVVFISHHSSPPEKFDWKIAAFPSSLLVPWGDHHRPRSFRKHSNPPLRAMRGIVNSYCKSWRKSESDADFDDRGKIELSMKQSGAALKA